MATSRVRVAPASVTAKVTSKGQITIPVEIRRQLGVKPGDRIRFEQSKQGIRLLNEAEQSVFEKWRGIGTGFPIQGTGLKSVATFFREMRGHDDLN